MKKNILNYSIKLILFLSLLIFNKLNVNASNNIACLDINNILNNTYSYNKYILKLNNKFKEYYIKYIKYINILINKEKILNSKKYYINLNKFKFLKYILFVKKKKIFNNLNKIQYLLNRENILIYKKTLFKIFSIINNISYINKYDLVFDLNYIFYYNNKNIDNITNYIINIINKKNIFN